MSIKPGTPLDNAIVAAGGVARLGGQVGVSHTTISKWRAAGQVPVDRVLAVEAATGISRALLRPDFFGAASRPVAAETQAPFAEAQALGLDAGRIAAEALREAVRMEKGRRWLAENREAIAGWNRWTEENGLPLAEHRMF